MGAFGFFDHDSRDGSEFWQRVQRFYRAERLPELVGQQEPALVLGRAQRRRRAQALDGSPGHRKNILTARWREMSLSALTVRSAPGVYGGRDVVIITTHFGVRF